MGKKQRVDVWHDICSVRAAHASHVCLGVCNNRVVSCQPGMSVWRLGLVPVFVVSGSTCSRHDERRLQASASGAVQGRVASGCVTIGSSVANQE